MIFSRKITLKDDISGILEKDDIHPRTYVISSDKKIKDNVYFYENVSVILCTFMETFIGVFIYCFLMKKTKTKKPRKLVCRTEIETPSFQSSRVLFKGVFKCQLKKSFVHQKRVVMLKIAGAVAKSFQCTSRSKIVRAKNLVKVATIGEVMSRRRSIILRELSFKFHHENIVTKARCFNYTNS